MTSRSVTMTLSVSVFGQFVGGPFSDGVNRKRDFGSWQTTSDVEEEQLKRIEAQE